MITTSTAFNLHCKSFCWEFLELFNQTEFSSAHFQRVLDYNTDNDITPLPSLQGKDLFESINDLSICRNKDVRKFLYLYLTRGRNFIIKSIKRSANYLNVIENEFDKNPQFPKDIMYLPLLESGFNPYAVSRSRAVGLWQFLKSTSKILGLKTNYWVDERRDVRKSTIAAIQHLKNLYSIFNSWELTLAAYNGGGLHVKRSMNKTGRNEFWSLHESSMLQRETNEYVPRFAALLVIYKNQKFFGLDEEIGTINRVDLDQLTFIRPVNIRLYSRTSGIPVKTIRTFNPELKRNTTPPYQDNYSLKIPEEYAKRIALSMNTEFLSDVWSNY